MLLDTQTIGWMAAASLRATFRCRNLMPLADADIDRVFDRHNMVLDAPRDRRIKTLPVVDRACRVIGLFGFADFMHAADLQLRAGFAT